MKLRKIIASATLSVCLATSAVIATTSLNKTGAYAATQNVDTSGIARTVVASGSGASVSYVTDKKQISGSSTFTGLRLTGNATAKFDLGSFKLDTNKLYWNGNVYDSTVAGTYTGTNDHDKKANADNEKSYGSIFSFVFDPVEATSVTGDLEINDMFITFTEVGNETNYVQMYVHDDHTGSGMGNDNGLEIYAKGTNNDGKKGSSSYVIERYRSAGTTLTESARKQINAYGNQTTPIDLVWDNEKVTAYSNTSFGEKNYDGISGAWGLRQMNKEQSYYAKGAKGQDEYAKRGYSPWNGFTDGATLKCTVEFAGVDAVSPTSIIVTSFGGYDLTVPTQEIDESEISAGELKVSGQNSDTVTYGTDVYIYAPIQAHRFGGGYVTDAETNVYYAGKIINTLTYGQDGKSTAKLTFNKEGIYTLKHKIGNVTLEEVIKCESNQTYQTASLASEFDPSEGATATYGEKTVLNAGGRDFYLTSNENAKKTYKGIVLTGGANATFKLNKPIDITQFKWNDASSFDSLFEFAITPDGKTRAKAKKTDDSEWSIAIRDLNSLTFVIEDAEDPSQKVTVTYSGTGEITEDQNTEKSSVSAAANGQTPAAYRENKGGYVASCPKETGFNGNAKETTKVVFDYKKNSLYSNVVFANLTGDSYLIRDFNDASNGSAWAGFKSGKVRISVQFGTLVTNKTQLTMHTSYITNLKLAEAPTPYRTDDSELTETSIVLTSIAGYDLSKESFAVSHENDIVSYFNQDGTLFDETDKNTTVKTVNDDILLPSVTQSNFINGNIDFDGYYEFIAPSGAVIADGAYANYGVITSDKLLAAGRGTYTLNITDAYNRTKTVEYKVGAILTAEVSKNATLYLNGKKYSEGEEIIVHDDNVAVRVELNEGYEVEGYKIDDDNCTLINVGGDLYLEANAVKSKNVFRPVVSATKYTISYGFFDSAITDIPESQIFTVETRDDLALATPTVEGKTFTGWYLNGRKISSVADLKLENVTLTGAFGEKRITVTFVVDEEESYGYKFEGGSLTDYVPQKDGYVFEGWFDEDGNEVNLANVAADVKVYAKFTLAGEIPTGDKETAGVNDGEASVIDAEIKEPYYIGVVELVSFGLAALGLAGAIVGLILFLKKKKAGAAQGIADGVEANADEINEEKGE